MGGIEMKKGQKKRVWSKEQKLEIINKHLRVPSVSKKHAFITIPFFDNPEQEIK